MNNLSITATKYTPEVKTDISKGLFSIKGRSLAEDSVDFYSQLFSFLKEYYSNPSQLTTFEMTFEYLNSTSLKLIIDFIVSAKKLTVEPNKVEFKWFYEDDDDDILMTGKEIERITGIPIKFETY